MFPSQTRNKLLGRELGRVVYQYLQGYEQTEQKELIEYVVEKILLEELKETFSGALYVGSHYELTAVSNACDYDVQFYLELPYALQVVSCDDSAWAKVIGGPYDLFDKRGYLSTSKVRLLLQDEIDKVLQGNPKTFKDELVQIFRSGDEAATKICVRWGEMLLNINLVVALQAKDLYSSWLWCGEFPCNLTAIPYSSSDYRRDDRWRLSYSGEEVNKLQSLLLLDSNLLRIVKVIRQHQPELRYFTTYFYKHLLFKLGKENPRQQHYPWQHTKELSERFKEMIQVMHRALRNGVLPVSFNKKVNILQNESDLKMKELANYFERIIDRDAYIDLVLFVPDTDTYVPEYVLERYESESSQCNIL